MVEEEEEVGVGNNPTTTVQQLQQQTAQEQLKDNIKAPLFCNPSSRVKQNTTKTQW